MSSFLKYIGSDNPHAVAVQSGGRDGNPLDGGTQCVVQATPGKVVAVAPEVAEAVLTKEPALWEVVDGFTAADRDPLTPYPRAARGMRTRR